MKPFVCCDLETGGLDPAVHGLTEIGAVLAAHDGEWGNVTIEDRFSVLIRPVQGLQYTPNALAIQHRTMADLQRGMLEECALLRFYLWLRSLWQAHGAMRIYAHNAPFDLSFILAAHERLNLGAETNEFVPFPVGTDWRCSVEMFKRLRAQGVHDCHKANLDTVMQHYGLSLPEDARHTATADCEVTAYAVAAMMRDHRAAQAPREQLVLAGQLGPGHE